MQERWLSVGEIAAHLGVNPDTIYKWITRKKMPAHKLGRLWKFLASEVDQWVKGGLIVASWNGPIAGGELRFAYAGHPDFFSQAVSGYPVVSVAHDKLHLYLTS